VHVELISSARSNALYKVKARKTSLLACVLTFGWMRKCNTIERNEHEHENVNNVYGCKKNSSLKRILALNTPS
jgi:hypothetical protein